MAEISDAARELIHSLSDGNPGAINVLCAMTISYGREEALKLLKILDKLEVHGSIIWAVYKDVCGSSLENYAKLIRHEDHKLLAKPNDA